MGRQYTGLWDHGWSTCRFWAPDADRRNVSRTTHFWLPFE